MPAASKPGNRVKPGNRGNRVRSCNQANTGSTDATGDITSEHGAYHYQYDNADHLTQASYPDNTEDAYSYDPVGNRITDQTTGVTQWEYAPDDRLLKAGAEQH